MPYSYRVFCRDSAVPSLSELLVWMRQFESPLVVVGGRSAGDLLSTFWEEVHVTYESAEAPLTVRCFRADARGMARLREERDDFVEDLEDLAPSSARGLVLDHLNNSQAVAIVEFAADGVSFAAQEAARGITMLFVNKAAGLAQRDGVGFFDEDDDVILKLG